MASSNKARDEFAEVNGLRLHYREWGDARSRNVLLMLHGYAETAGVWDDVAQDLAREYRVISLDQRGHGQSAHAPDFDYTRATQVEDVEAFIEAMALKSLTIVGHAMGGANALCYASEHPDIVTALIVVEAAPEVLRGGVERLRRMVGSAEEFESLSDAVESMRPLFPYATTEQLERRARSALVEKPEGAWVWDFDPALRDASLRPPEPDPGQRRLADLWECADRVQCPVMIVRGSETDMLTPEAIQRLHRRIVGSRVSLIEEAGHPVPSDQPAHLALNIREFLQNLQANAV